MFGQNTVYGSGAGSSISIAIGNSYFDNKNKNANTSGNYKATKVMNYSKSETKKVNTGFGSRRSAITSKAIELFSSRVKKFVRLQ